MTREEYAKLKNQSIGKTLLKGIKDGEEIVIDYQDILDETEEAKKLREQTSYLIKKEKETKKQIRDVIHSLKEIFKWKK